MREEVTRLRSKDDFLYSALLIMDTTSKTKLKLDIMGIGATKIQLKNNESQLCCKKILICQIKYFMWNASMC